MSLLTKASTVTTPTAYSDGFLHSVKPVENLGSELVTNGSFDSGSDWNLTGSNVSISSGKLNFVNATTNTEFAQQVIVAPIDKKYKITLEVSNLGSGDSIKIRYPFQDTTINTNGLHTVYGVGTLADRLRITPNSSTATFSIDNISVKEVLGADFDFARASSATRVNEQGYIEKERENLLLQSNSFDTTWVNTNSSVTSGQSGYDGSSDAWLFEATTNSPQIIQSVSASGVNTYSVYAKAGSVDWLRMLVVGSTNYARYFDLVNGVKGSSVYSTEIDSSIESVGSGWYKCTITTNTTINQVRLFLSNADLNQTGTSSGNIYIQDAQLEQGLVATDYIETTTSSVAVGITNDIPRINYEGGNGHFLLEPQRTNNFTYSEYIIGWSTSNTGVTVEENAVTSPEGVINATKIKEDGTNAAHAIRQLTGPSLTSGTDYTFSFFAKKAERSIVGLSNTIGTSNDKICFFDLENGQVLTNTFNSVSIEDFGNGWFRCIATDTADANDDYDTRIYTATADNQFTHQGVSGSGFYIFGLQLEAASYATSYIPTYGSATTRAAETCNNAGNSDLFNDSEGVLYAEIAALDDDLTQRHISISDGSTDDVIRIHYFTTSNSIRGQVRVGGVIQASLTYIVPDIKDFHKVALSYKENDVKLYIDGVLVLTDTSASMPTGLDTLMFDNGGGGNDFYGKTKMVSTFTEALSDSELECLTSWSSFNRMATAQGYDIE